MKIKNESIYRTDQLRKLATAIAKREPLLTKEGMKRLSITFGDRWVLRYGDGKYPGKIGVKVPGKELTVRVLDLAKNLAWCIGVSVGLRRKDMKGLAKYSYQGDWQTYYAWVKDYPIEVKPKLEVTEQMKDATLRKRRQNNVEKAQTMVGKWERNLKLASTKLTVWRRKLKAAEKELAKIQQTMVLELSSESAPVATRKFRAEQPK